MATMIKSFIISVACLLSFNTAGAQTESSFEFSLPRSWADKENNLKLNSDHYKDGSQSLQWKASSKNPLTFTSSEPIAYNNAVSFNIYLKKETADTLFVDFMDGSKLFKRAQVLLNFKGWRAFNRSFNTYENNKRGDYTSIIFSVNSAAKETTILLDVVNLNAKIDKSFEQGLHMAADVEYLSESPMLLNWALNTPDITASKGELKEYKAVLKKLKTKYAIKSKKSGSGQLNSARTFVESLGIKYNSDGTPVGKPIDITKNLNKKYVIKASDALKVLSLSESSDDHQIAQILLDYLLDQGIAASVPFYMNYGDYTTMRTVPINFLTALNACRKDQVRPLLDLVAWITEYGKVFTPEADFLPYINADAVTNMIAIYYTYVISMPDAIDQIKGLKALTRFLERHTAYVPGGKDILKVDGMGFHHKTHYNGYMYALNHWINYVYDLKGSPLMVNIDSFDRIKKAITSMYVMVPNSKDDEKYMANSLSGRNMFGRNGAKLQVPADGLKKLLEIGGELQGKDFDPELAALYNSSFENKQYGVESVNLDGFYAFNYSPSGVYRKDNWVATMHSPTTKLWGSEIYNKTNRFGRYQSHGTLEVIYPGGLKNSGYPDDKLCGGWDWNVYPGSTTVHYTNWRELMPSSNDAQRFDQYTKTSDFSGALSFDGSGIFAAEFDQGDHWGKQCYAPTNLTFRKSVFAFDDILVSIADHIGSSGEYSEDMITASNLFQNIIYKKGSPIYVNDQVIDGVAEMSLNSYDGDIYLVDAQSTGYIIKKGNDPLTVKYGLQKSPIHTGEDVDNPKTEVLAAKAFINHGVKPLDKRFHYIVVPNTTIEELKEVNNSYTILYQNEEIHALQNGKKTFYSVFSPFENLDKGVLVASKTQLLLIAEEKEDDLEIAVCNPNLNPIADKDFGWISTPTNASIQLRGVWKLSGNNDNIKVSVKDNVTELDFVLTDGQDIQFQLTK